MMLKKILLWILVLLLVFELIFVVRLFLLGAQSAKASAPGLVNGKLSRCPPSPNCFNSEFADDTEHHTAPVTLVQSDAGKVKQVVLEVIEGMDGRVVSSEGDYIAATFTSKVFRFVDDFEVRIDPESGLMHLRSASRVGYGDMGANGKRVDKFTSRFAKQVGANP